jgi:uncharacterized protein (TIGR02246 family)
MNKNENSVQEILETYKTAVYDKDIESFMSIYDENIEVFDMWGTTWAYRGAHAWREMTKEWFGGLGDERVVVDIEGIQVKQTEAMAFVSAFLKYTALSAEGKSLRSLQSRMTCVLESKNGVWKVIHEHTSAPVDHTTLKVSLKR